ncbi:MAG: tetratricopeptide repeat protein [Planctomycetota bacterium]
MMLRSLVSFPAAGHVLLTCLTWVAIGAVASPLPAAEPDPRLKAAREHLQRGRAEEGLEAYEELVQDKVEPVAVAIGIAECQAFEGHLAAARETITKTLADQPKSPALLAKLAELHFAEGDYATGLQRADEALKIEPEWPLAKLLRADCLTELGQLKEADEEYRWCVRYYNRAQPTAADDLLVVGRGSAQYARWHSASQVFKFVVNTLCPDALKNDPLCWQAYWLSGSLLLEKYNREDALPELQQALKINPRAPDVLATLGEAAFQKLDLTEAAAFAERALAVNPQHIAALQLQADLAMRDGDAPRALAALEKALKANPHEQRTIARMASVYLMADGVPPDAELTEVLTHLDNVSQIQLPKPSRFSQTLIDLAKRNPHPGYGLQVLGDDLQRRLRFELAEKFYRAAMTAMPQYAEPKTALGLLYMRIGKTDEARKILDKAFDADPFHIRVGNMRKVIKLLDDYSTISTDHFVVRVDSQTDRLLGKYLSEYLEEIYPQLTQQFGYEPPTRTQFEIFNKAKGLSAHQWFSARMTGLPWIQTIGASTGWIVALASPTASEKGFNWAKVVKHEFVHIVTLQQTQFNCPHWFTEALAVLSEESPRPEVWTRLLLERVPKGELMNLDNINLGFQRPKTPLDWQMAYCQSHLYASYLIEKHGPDSLQKLLNAYREGLPTAKAIEKVCGQSQADFEKGYVAYVKELTSKLQTLDAEPQTSLKELRQKLEAAPNDSQAAGRLAFALVSQRQTKEARQLAEATLKKTPTEPLAAATMAVLALKAEDTKQALAVLEPALDREKPNPTVLRLLAKLKFEQEDFAEAATLYELAVKFDPDNKVWLQNLGTAYAKAGERDKLEGVLKRLVDLDFESVAPRKKLAELMLERKEYSEAVRYSRLALHIDVMDAEVHRVLGQAYAELKQTDKAIDEYSAVLELDAEDLETPLTLAKLLIAANKPALAKEKLEALLKAHPNTPEAAALLKTIKL